MFDPLIPQSLEFMRSTGVCNVGIALLALALVAMDSQRAQAALFPSAAMIAGLDCLIVAQATGLDRAFKHALYVIGLLGFGAWLWSRV